MHSDDRRVTRAWGSGLRWLVLVLVGSGMVLLIAQLLVPDRSESQPTSTSRAGNAGAETSRAAVTQYVDLWLDGDYIAMRELASGTAEDFLEMHESWARLMEIATADIGVSFEEQTSNRSSWKLRFAFSFVNGDSWIYQSEIHAIDEGGRWLIDWSPATIHPDLEFGQRLDASLIWPDRAPILARDGTSLTDERRVVQIGVIPERIEDVEEVSQALSEQVGVDAGVIDDALRAPGVQPDWFLPIIDVRPRDYREVRPYLYPVPGIAFREDLARLGPDGFATHVLGRVRDVTAEQLAQLGDPYRVGDQVGRFGLEEAMERRLAGEPGVRVAILTATGEVEDLLFESTGSAPEPVATTLDVRVQRAVEKALDGAPEPSAMVVLDAETAAIRGVASRPLAGFNRALSGRYPPGSTFKVVTAAALLGNGLSPESTVECPGKVDVAGREFQNAGGFDIGPTSLIDAFTRSCNTTFASLGVDLPSHMLIETAEEFGFNEMYGLPVDVAGGRFPAPSSPAEQGAASIGQGRVLASPIHMASVAAAVASGSWAAPHLLARTEPREPIALSIDPKPIREMMRAVVTRGTGTEADVEGEPVFAKTGSAEFGEDDPPSSHAWFVGFRGDLAFAVLVEGGGSGGEVAAPIAAEFLRAMDEPISVLADGRPSCAEGSWPTFQGTMVRSGCTTAPGISEPRLLWRQNVGIQAWLNSPVVTDDRVYVGSAGLDRGRSDPGDGVYSIDLRDGRVIWRFSADNDVNGVSVGDGLVVATGDQGEVWALDAGDGALHWSLDSEGSMFFTSPLIIEDLVIVGSSDGVLHALELDSGRIRWTVEFDSPLRGGAASDGEAIYAIGEAGDVRAFDLDGREYWRQKLNFATLASDTLTARVFAAPTIVGDHVIVPFVRDDVYPVPALTALDRYTGSVRWEASDPNRVASGWGNLRSSPAVAGDLLVFGDPTFPGLAAVGIEDGQAKWSIPAGKGCLDQWPSPTVTGQLAVLPRADGGIYAFDYEELDLRWSAFLGRQPGDGDFPVGFEGMPCSTLVPIQASPAVAPDGSIVIGTLEGDLLRIAEGF